MDKSLDGASSPVLCGGYAIEYKAYARSFTPDQDLAILYLVATCWFGRGNLALFFEDAPDGFRLMVQSLPGAFPNLDTYYIATWPPKGSPGLRQLPSEVSIQDAHGTQLVKVESWN